MLATSARSGWEALGIPKRRPRQKQLKASRRKVRLLDREQRHHQYHFWQNKTTKKTPKPKNCFKKKSKGHPSNSRIRGWLGGGAQNWPALLGSHCSRRTMLGSLLAPRMNSSRESFPSLLVSIWRKIFSVLFSGVDSSSGIFITDETIL